MNPERFSLREAIEEVCAVANAIRSKKRIGLKVNVAPALRYVTLDQQKLSRSSITSSLTRLNSPTRAATWKSWPNRTTQTASNSW